MWGEHTSTQKAAIGASDFASIGTLGASYVVDKLTNGGLFGTTWKATGGGLSLGVGADGLESANYVEQKKKKSFFRGNAYQTNYSSVDDQLQAFLSGQYGAVTSGIKTGAGILGGSGDLSGFTSAAKRSAWPGSTPKPSRMPLPLISRASPTKLSRAFTPILATMPSWVKVQLRRSSV